MPSRLGSIDGSGCVRPAPATTNATVTSEKPGGHPRTGGAADAVPGAAATAPTARTPVTSPRPRQRRSMFDLPFMEARGFWLEEPPYRADRSREAPGTRANRAGSDIRTANTGTSRAYGRPVVA